ncbi:protein G1-like1 [Brachypodium distachyon]|uniref:ALOG domain-containing protein n=1 Tax=Brachypodium distachyon TaxID=15368 RepID=I1HXL2_BRADI|nr:protein G1-like1 [Brachypodium distachyon]KQJ93496.1 hypothetical protein BRADI_3g04960v3 [Brachypodium distachyon]|eukprot:XP_003569939.1 protein G1-like1 [Brachypodium distachyon]
MDMSGMVAAADSPSGGGGSPLPRPSRYESQKRRDWQTFGQYLRNHRPPLELSRCSGAHVLEFLRYLDQFGKTKVHGPGCPFFGHPSPPGPCPCPLKQAWGSLDALVGRLRAAFEEHGGRAEANPFGARAVRLYLRDVRDSQAKARGIAYEKKRRKRNSNPQKPKPEKKQEKPPNQEAAASEMASAAVGEIRPPELVATPYPPYYLFPHGHLFQGHYLAPASGEGSHAAAAALDGVPGGGAGAGEDIVLVMAAAAAAAEAHAAGCLMPLSVFN